jgi:hypothetical protein
MPHPTNRMEERLMHRNRKSMLVSLIVGCLSLIALMAAPSGAAAKDRNHDRIPDRWEKRHHLSLHVNQAHRDQDRDGLDNRGEFRAGDDPRNDDTDDDGVVDGEENAGTISAFDATTGKLTIALFGGESVNGLVTPETEIKCEGVDDDSSASASRDHGGEESGDDHGGRGEEEPGDDRGGDNSGPGRGDGENDDNGAQCTTADLQVGAFVHEADLEAHNGVATFDEVELAHTS